MPFRAFFRWKELLSTFDPLLHAKVVGLLDRASIPCRVRTHHTGNGDRRSGALGSLGERPQYGVQYRILVRKEYWELARHICQQEAFTPDQ